MSLSQSGAVRRKLVIAVSILVFLVGLAGALWFFTWFKNQRERVAWKTKALERLAGLSFTNKDISQEVKTVQAGMPEWVGEHVLLMTNNEYLVYASRHGLNSGFIDHLFLGHGSDGRWYYSTYHFCNSMVSLRGEDPPGSIKEFMTRYSGREFDGRSDECLRHTWP